MAEHLQNALQQLLPCQHALFYFYCATNPFWNEPERSTPFLLGIPFFFSSSSAFWLGFIGQSTPACRAHQIPLKPGFVVGLARQIARGTGVVTQKQSLWRHERRRWGGDIRLTTMCWYAQNAHRNGREKEYGGISRLKTAALPGGGPYRTGGYDCQQRRGIRAN